jgi:hypothetical protein
MEEMQMDILELLGVLVNMIDLGRVEVYLEIFATW